MLVLNEKSPTDTVAAIPCSRLKGVGNRIVEHLAKCAIYSVQDLLFHLPLRYEDRTRITPLAEAKVGDHVVIQGTVEFAEVSQRKRRSLLCQLWDGTGRITLRFFHFTYSQQQSLKRGAELRCFGEIRGWMGELEMIHPEYQFVQPHTPLPKMDTLTPVYSTTEGLTQRVLRSLTEQALELLKQKPILPDYLTAEIVEKLHLPNLLDAIIYVHRPPPNAPVKQLLEGRHPAQLRLAFEELLAHHLSLRQLRHNMQHHAAPAMPGKNQLTTALISGLAFKLTAAQERVLQQISQDMAKPHPMLRLLQGDVGSGKTIVAAVAALQAVENNWQAALMAPTELLAEQHFHNFQRWLEPLGLEIAWLAGKLKGKTRELMLEKIKTGTAAVIVGTHALFQEEVEFAKLGLVMIDEQHRFGVHQRLALREKGKQDGLYPHQLVMTATPIPRTLAMTAYADLDTSVIDELPPGRTPIQTIVVSDKRRDDIVARVRLACAEKKQVYWVCPLIEESEALQCQAAESTAQHLIAMLPEVRIGLVHGRMNAKQKQDVMLAFKQHYLDLLVATTVIEVGVDVPNASLMIIENAERLGLAQLHQLRGRVGRGSVESFCVLMYQQLSQQAKARLAIMRETTDGFVIARRDLEIRGPGEVLGTRQTGMLQLRIADLLRDQNLLPKVQQAAELMFDKYPDRVKPLIQRWLAQGQHYARV